MMKLRNFGKRGFITSKRLLALFTCLTMIPGTVRDVEAASPSLTEAWKNITEISDSEDKNYNTTEQLTEEDILRMNDGDAAILYDENGYLTFLRGRYYDEKVADPEKGIESLFGIANLLGISKGSEFFAVFGERDYYGNTIITYKQRYGEVTLENAVLKIIIDPDGYTAGVVSSFVPNIGIAREEESSITPEEAEKIVLANYPEYHLLPVYTRQTSVTIQDVAYHAWAVFTTSPESELVSNGRGYLEHLVAYDGSYLMYMAVASPEELVLGDTAQTELAMSVFEGLVEKQYTGTVQLHDGTKKTITVPTAYDPETGIYYLADVNRHILLADYYSYVYGSSLEPWCSKDNSGWEDRYLLTYESYIKVYDFYRKYGLESVDGFGSPILILTDYCDENRNPENNACYLGMSAGWAAFAASSMNDYGECIDVSAHEYTHGVTTYSIGGNLYQNASGAVNEGLSDVMGNLCELLLCETEDTTWLMAEKSGYPVRSMSSPEQFRQPVVLGGKYYQNPSQAPAIENDFGGVHTNNSLISHVAWRLCDEGMGLEDAFHLWRETISLLTPESGYEELHQALIFASRIRSMDEKWITMIDTMCREAGY